MDDSKPWTHRSDLALLAFMKAFEAHIERRQQHITTSLQVVSTAVTDLSTNLSRISASSALLSNETFFEKQVESWDDLVNSRIGGGVAISEGTKQTDSQRHAEGGQGLLPQARDAFAAADHNGGRNIHSRTLPHIFGSAQFLQDSMAGLSKELVHTHADFQGASVSASVDSRSDCRGATGNAVEDHRCPRPSADSASDLESLRTLPQGGGRHKDTDFRAMLEAALRGDDELSDVPQHHSDVGGHNTESGSTRSLGGFSELWAPSGTASAAAQGLSGPGHRWFQNEQKDEHLQQQQNPHQ